MYRISLGRVHERVKITEGRESLTLLVDADPMQLTIGLKKSQAQMEALKKSKNRTEEDNMNAARFFASVIFGKEQAEKLIDFYNNDPSCIVSVCYRLLSGRLAALIVKAQKRRKK